MQVITVCGCNLTMSVNFYGAFKEADTYILCTCTLKPLISALLASLLLAPSILIGIASLCYPLFQYMLPLFIETTKLKKKKGKSK